MNKDFDSLTQEVTKRLLAIERQLSTRRSNESHPVARFRKTVKVPGAQQWTEAEV